MIKILISPAKSLNFDPIEKKIDHSELLFKNEAYKVASVLKKLKPEELKNLMGISDKLAQLNWTRNQEYKKDFGLQHAKQALFAFDGEVYNGIDANSLNVNQISFLQKNLRILSGQYGYLRPLDLIMPYRLEMGTKLSVENSSNLYDFWSEKVTAKLNSELDKSEVIINLASEEYFKVIDKKKIKNKIITPVFKDYKNGKLTTISFFAKKARGLAVNYLSSYDGSKSAEEYLKDFSAEGYRYLQSESNEYNYLFAR